MAKKQVHGVTDGEIVFTDTRCLWTTIIYVSMRFQKDDMTAGCSVPASFFGGDLLEVNSRSPKVAIYLRPHVTLVYSHTPAFRIHPLVLHEQTG